MKALSLVSLLACAAILIGVAITHHQQLPEKMASHFNGAGVPDGWKDKSSFTASTIAVGLGMPLFVIGIMYSIRFFPPKFLNVPNADYWRKPENYRKACDFLFASSLWFGSAFILWQVFFSRLVLAANQASPPHLDSSRVILLTGVLLAFVLGWIVFLIGRFLKVDKTA